MSIPNAKLLLIFASRILANNDVGMLSIASKTPNPPVSLEQKF